MCMGYIIKKLINMYMGYIYWYVWVTVNWVWNKPENFIIPAIVL